MILLLIVEIQVAPVGPHLHYEIRNTKTEHILNPLIFGLYPEDTISPVFQSLMSVSLSPPIQELITIIKTPLSL